MQATNSSELPGNFPVSLPPTPEAAAISLPPSPATSDWEREVDRFLAELSAVQEQVLQMLGRKRQALIAGDHQELAKLGTDEQAILSRLGDCHRRRG